MSEKSQPLSNLNRVLQPEYRPSNDFYASDLLLQSQVQKSLPENCRSYLQPLLQNLGRQAANKMDALSLMADKNEPQLIKRNTWGETVNEIRFHPAYWDLMQIAVDSQMFRLKWEPKLRKRFAGNRHKMGFALGMLYAMSESGQYCPLCMTDGVAHLIDQFCTEGDRERLLPHIYSDRLANFFTGAMFLTEKAGGSDVGANLTVAIPIENAESATSDEPRLYELHGEKWFCSNVNAQLIFALARTQADRPGIYGLSIFLIERELSDGKVNPIEIVRLKEKLGVRSMASGECLLKGTVGKLIGEELKGFSIMAEMINLSRMYNSVAALAGGRRALVEAYQFLSHRHTFGKLAIEHALVRGKLWELGSMQRASNALVWRAITAMDQAEAGDENAAQLLRILTPMVKRDSANIAVYICRESMELMGGMGYIEDTVIPKIMRDMMVLPIWEGTSNIMMLDMLRASMKSSGLETLVNEIREICEKYDHEVGNNLPMLAVRIKEAIWKLPNLPQQEMEYQAEPLFQRLTLFYQAALLLQEMMDGSDIGVDLAWNWVIHKLGFIGRPPAPPNVNQIKTLMAWVV